MDVRPGGVWVWLESQGPSSQGAGSFLGRKNAQQPAWHWGNLRAFPGFIWKPRCSETLPDRAGWRAPPPPRVALFGFAPFVAQSPSLGCWLAFPPRPAAPLPSPPPTRGPDSLVVQQRKSPQFLSLPQPAPTLILSTKWCLGSPFPAGPPVLAEHFALTEVLHTVASGLAAECHNPLVANEGEKVERVGIKPKA